MDAHFPDTGERKTLILDRGEYTSCTINLHGCAITSWRIRNEEQLFISGHATFDEKQPVAGGISLAFPHYSAWTFGPEDGFAKIMRWKVEQEATTHPNRDVEARLSLVADDFSRSMWNFSFGIACRVLLQERGLRINVEVTNTDAHLPFYFELMLQCALKASADHSKVSGLNNCPCRERRMIDDSFVLDSDETVIVDGQIDRLYRATPDVISIARWNMDKGLEFRKSNLPDIIISNPSLHLDGCEEEQPLAWIEFGKILNPTRVVPGESFAASIQIHKNKDYTSEINPDGLSSMNMFNFC